jgi:hypothetical protein
MSFNNYSNSYDNANNINQPPDDNIIYDTFINSSNASLVVPTLVIENNNIQDEDEMPPLVEDTSSSAIDVDDLLYGFVSRYLMESDINRYPTDYDRISLNRLSRMFVLAIRQHRAHREEREARKFNIATRVREENDEQIKIECNICYELCNNTNFIKLNCNHEFCKECLKNILKSCKRNFNEPCCAYCREKINAITYKNETIHEEFTDLIAITSFN